MRLARTSRKVVRWLQFPAAFSAAFVLASLGGCPAPSPDDGTAGDAAGELPRESPPPAPASPQPANAASGVSVEVDLDWEDAPGATSYDVYFGTTNPPTMQVGNTTSSNWPLPTLSYSTKYYWKVVAKNSVSSTAGCVWSFTTVQQTASAGSILGWGTQVVGSEFTAHLLAVAGGESHSLGLKGDGSIVAWGWNLAGQCNVPAPNTGFAAVAGGEEHSLGLKADGSIAAWGWNYYGQCNVPSPNTGFVAVSGGYGHSLGLKADGSIVAWGSNGFGQCNVSAPNTDFVAVAAGDIYSLGLRGDGSIVA
jgi:hypothetical protein